MGKIAFVFSGQGAQKAGMGKAFYEEALKLQKEINVNNAKSRLSISNDGNYA